MAPRVFIIRHGETEWSLSGQHTGRTDIPLTANGEKRIRATGKALVGDDRLIVPQRLAHVYVSPRKRAQRTLELLYLGTSCTLPWQNDTEKAASEVHQAIRCDVRITINDDVQEWDYGDYEGLTSKQIRAQRKELGQPEGWDIWSDGCPGGESPADINRRLDKVIHEIRERFHAPALEREKLGEKGNGDVLIVAHGHILRALAARWVGRDVRDNPSLILEAGGVGTLSYEHQSLEEPAILLGGAFV